MSAFFSQILVSGVTSVYGTVSMVRCIPPNRVSGVPYSYGPLSTVRCIPPNRVSGVPYSYGPLSMVPCLYGPFTCMENSRLCYQRMIDAQCQGRLCYQPCGAGFSKRARNPNVHIWGTPCPHIYASNSPSMSRQRPNDTFWILTMFVAGLIRRRTYVI